MNVKIFQKGGSKDNHDILLQAADYFADLLMTKRMSNTLNIRLEMRSSKLSKKTMGTCSTASIGSKSNKDFTIVMQRDMNINDQLETLSHELVHVYQKAHNTLQYRKWKSDGLYHARWNGQDVGLAGEIPYMERPWEIEAYKLEKPMKAAFVNYFKNNTEKEAERRDEVRGIMQSITFSRESEKELSA